MLTDSILHSLEKTYPPPSWTDRSEFLFEDLIDTVISQQLSGKAAETIFNRFKAFFHISPDILGLSVLSSQPQNEESRISAFPKPEQILAIPQETFRTIGISRAKSNYIHNVAEAFHNGNIITGRIKTMTDEDVIETLTQIKGIGKWSAEMILIFTLNRPDIFSLGDLGLRTAIKNLYGITDPKEILALAQTWSPNRSLASWYLLRSLENKP